MNLLEVRTLELLKKILGETPIETQAAKVFGRPDFLIPALNTAVFADGAFWHDGYRAPMTSLGLRLHARGELERADFWLEKAGRNKTRDREVNRVLRKQGFLVLRLKSGRIMGRDPEAYISKSLSALLVNAARRRRTAGSLKI